MLDNDDPNKFIARMGAEGLEMLLSRIQLDEDVTDAYADAVRYVEKTYYLEGGVTRHTTNAFTRLKLSSELAKRSLDPSLQDEPPV